MTSWFLNDTFLMFVQEVHLDLCHVRERMVYSVPLTVLAMSVLFSYQHLFPSQNEFINDIVYHEKVF